MPYRPRVLSLFGTRPEIIKFSPVIAELDRAAGLDSVVACTSQHSDLLRPSLALFGIELDYDLDVMRPGQGLNKLTARLFDRIDDVLVESKPDLVLVQGDTTTAFAGAMAAWYRRIPVGHIEAGLRTDTIDSPFPEELNRRFVTRLASMHFAPTAHNVATLVAEGVDPATIFLTGNPVVDALHHVLAQSRPSPALTALLREVDGQRLIVLTTHRREAFGEEMARNLAVLRDFIDRHEGYALIFPVHPNPEVRAVSAPAFAGSPRCRLIDPLDYQDFIHLLNAAWLIASDSGGVQEEAPTLGKPLFILRKNTERPEAVTCGVARLLGGSAERLATMLEEVANDDTWIASVRDIVNPFGDGHGARRIVDAISARFAANADSHAVAGTPS